MEAVRNYRVLRGFRVGEFGRATKDLTPGHRRWDFSPELRTILGGILLKNWSKSQLLYRGHFESLSINQNRARTVCSAACFEIHTRQAHNLKVTGSNPVPATRQSSEKMMVSGAFCCRALGQQCRSCGLRVGRRAAALRSNTCRQLEGPSPRIAKVVAFSLVMPNLSNSLS